MEHLAWTLGQKSLDNGTTDLDIMTKDLDNETKGLAITLTLTSLVSHIVGLSWVRLVQEHAPTIHNIAQLSPAKIQVPTWLRVLYIQVLVR